MSSIHYLRYLLNEAASAAMQNADQPVSEYYSQVETDCSQFTTEMDHEE